MSVRGIRTKNRCSPEFIHYLYRSGWEASKLQPLKDDYSSIEIYEMMTNNKISRELAMFMLFKWRPWYARIWQWIWS